MPRHFLGRNRFRGLHRSDAGSGLRGRGLLPRIKRLILYDLDGTLVDTWEDIILSIQHMLRQMGVPELPRGEIVHFVGRGVGHLVASCLKSDDPARIEQGVNIYRDFYAQHLLDHARLYPGALRTLEHFKDRKQAVITNKPNPYSCQILSRLKVEDYFVQIVAGDSEYPRKPDPSSVQAIMRRYRIPPKEALFVGDSAIDVQTGRNAGCATVVVKHRFSDEDEIALAAPDRVVQRLDDLIALSQREGW